MNSIQKQWFILQKKLTKSKRFMSILLVENLQHTFNACFS